MHSDIQEILFTKDDVDQRVMELGKQLSEDYKGLHPLCICVLKGAVIFTADLIRHMDIPLEIDVMAVSSYGNSTTSSGVVRIMKDLEATVEDRHVLIVEDIIDTGLTLQYLTQLLQGRNPSSLKIVSLLDKSSRRKVAFQPNYCGYEVEDHFVVGYGFDYAEKYRNLPYIGILKKEVYS
jgi:hypoxanthine phosphoribosyltransferase